MQNAKGGQVYSPMCLSAVDMEVHGHFVFAGEVRDDTGSGFLCAGSFRELKW